MKPAALPAELAERLELLETLILKWDRRINLLGGSTRDDVRQRHILDCLQLLDHVPVSGGAIVDCGSGAGLPGLVLAIARPDRLVRLVEADQRKAAFLRDASRALGLRRVEVHASRIEQCAFLAASVMTARALAPLPRLLAMTVPHMAEGGIALFPKGRGVDAELTEALRGWTMNIERFASRTDTGGTILRLSGIAQLGGGP